MMSQLGNAAILSGALLFIPAFLTRKLVRAEWPQVLLAFPIYWLVLFLLLGFGTVSEEVLGWTFGMAMFTSWLGVPIVGLLLRLTSIPQRFR